MKPSAQIVSKTPQLFNDPAAMERQETQDVKIPNLCRTDQGVWRIKMRHPAMPGKQIDRSCNTTDAAVAVRVGEALDALKNPQWHSLDKEQDAKRIFPAVAVDAFYKPLRQRPTTDNGSPRVIATYYDEMGAEEEKQPFQKVCDKLTIAEQEIITLRRKCEFFEKELARLGHGPHNQQSLQTAFEGWSAEFHSKSARQKKAVVRRVRFVIENLKNVTLAELNKDRIDAAITKSMSVVRSKSKKAASSAYEVSYRTRDMKRLLAWIADEYEMRAIAKLVKTLHAPSVETIARSQNGGVGILAVDALTKLLDSTATEPFESLQAAVYWRALIGMLVYSGMRLGELCVLTWDDVNFDNILSVRDTRIKTTKTLASNRPVRPLPELWPLLRALQPVTGSKPFVFPALLDGKLTDECWLIENDGKMIAQRLTRCLIRMEEILGLGRQIPQRARRTCRGLMLNRGAPGHVLDTMLGHSGDVGAAHYQNSLQIVNGFKFA